MEKNLLSLSQILTTFSLSFLVQPGYGAIPQPHHTSTMLALGERGSTTSSSSRALPSKPGVEAVQTYC